MLTKKEMISKLLGEKILMREQGDFYDVTHAPGMNSRDWIITDVGEDMFEAEFYINGKPQWKKNFSFSAIRSISPAPR